MRYEMQWQWVIHSTITADNISHQTFPAQRTIPYLTSFHTSISIQPDHISHGVLCNSVVWNLVWCRMPDVGCCALFILMWLWSGIRCDVEYVRHVVMLNVTLCNDEVWNVMWCGMMVWCMWNMVVCCDARCEMWLWNTKWCGMVWYHIRHGVLCNDDWNAAHCIIPHQTHLPSTTFHVTPSSVLTILHISYYISTCCSTLFHFAIPHFKSHHISHIMHHTHFTSLYSTFHVLHATFQTTPYIVVWFGMYAVG